MKDRQLNLLVSSRLVLAAITTSLLLNGAQARTWTSADGTKTFEGELKSYDPKIAVVTVVLSSGIADIPAAGAKLFARLQSTPYPTAVPSQSHGGLPRRKAAVFTQNPGCKP